MNNREIYLNQQLDYYKNELLFQIDRYQRVSEELILVDELHKKTILEYQTMIQNLQNENKQLKEILDWKVAQVAQIAQPSGGAGSSGLGHQHMRPHQSTVPTIIKTEAEMPNESEIQERPCTSATSLMSNNSEINMSEGNSDGSRPQDDDEDLVVLTDDETNSQVINTEGGSTMKKAHIIVCMKKNGTKQIKIKNSHWDSIEPMQCPCCPFIGDTYKSMYKHFQRFHLSRTPDKMIKYSCHICNQQFELTRQLHDHLNTHTTDAFKCNHCSCLFENVSSLASHQNILKRLKK